MGHLLTIFEFCVIAISKFLLVTILSAKSNVVRLRGKCCQLIGICKCNHLHYLNNFKLTQHS